MVSEERGNIIFNWILRYGAIAVMGIWLFIVNKKIDFIEEKLYACLEGKAIIMTEGNYNRDYNGNNREDKQPIQILIQKAIRPDEIKIFEDETH
jgi:hypothetical protein